MAIVKEIRAVILDCDGVMFDTASVNRIYYNRILQHLGKEEMTDQDFAYAHMYTADGSLARLFPNPAEYSAAQAFRKIMPYGDFIPLMEPEPYLKTLLTRLRPRYKTAIATNRTDTMPRVLDEFDLKDDFDMVVTALDVENPKPHPEELLKILGHFSLSPAQALYVGDTQLDETAAKAAGVVFAAFKNPDLSADFHISGLKELADILRLEDDKPALKT
ncbi:MAG: HAD family hydrolase [Desulfococcaceae bacterium]